MKTLCIILMFLAVARIVLSHVDLKNRNEPTLMTSKSHLDERQHIKEHLDGVVGSSNINKMAEGELRFLYFKMHDNDHDNRLDGCELVKSLLHWHSEEHKATSKGHHHGTTKIFKHAELALMIDPILALDDRNVDGFIDYPEFVAAQKSRGF